MTETCEQEVVKSETGRNQKGQWIKGYCPNPKGNTSKLDVKNLVLALDSRAQQQQYPDFLGYVAARALINDQVLIAVLKKILPDKLKGEGFGDTKIIIVRDKEKKEENEDSAQRLPRQVSI